MSVYPQLNRIAARPHLQGMHRPTSIARHAVVLLAILAAASPAAAQQWSRVTEVPATTFFFVWANGDTIATSGDSTVYVSTDGGGTWKGSATVAPGVIEVERVRVRNGRLYAGARGQGMFVSDDLGGTWANFNQGLVGGFANSQLVIIDLLVRGDSMFVATDGSGPWVRNLRAGTWGPFGNALAPAQATGMTLIAAGGSRLFAAGGFNGTVFFRDPGQPDWTLSPLFNDRFAPRLAALSALWTGSRWVVGSNIGVFLSPQAQSPWTFVDPGAGRPLVTVPLVMRGHDLFANFGAFSSTIAVSRDEGTSWQLLETLPVPVSGLAILGNTLYASRFDGLWRRTLDDVPIVSVPPPSPRLGFVIAGAQPVSDIVRFRFDLPEPERAVIDVFDLAGRHVVAPIDGVYAAGPNEVTWNVQPLPSGVYHARLRVGPRTETLRLVRVR